MKHIFGFIAIAMCLLVAGTSAFAQTAGDYRTRQSGNWTEPDTWELFDGVNWVTEIQTGTTPAAPTIQTTASGIQSTNSSTHSITLPAGIVAGDLLLVVFSTDGGITVSINTGISGTGWNLLGQNNEGQVVGAIVWKIAQGGDVLTLNTSASDQSTHISYRISGGVSVSGSSTTGGSGDANPPNHTPPLGSQPYLWIATNHKDQGETQSTAPTDFGGLITRAGGTSSGGTTTASRTLTGSSLNPGTFTGGSSQNWVSFTLAVYGEAPVYTPITSPQTSFPTLASTSTSSQTSTSGTNQNITLPSGISVGDLLLVFYVDAGVSTTATLPAGWTTLYNTVGNNQRYIAMYRVATGSEGSTITVTTSGGERSAHVGYRIAAGSFFGAPTAGTLVTGTSVNPNAPNHTPPSGDNSYLWVAAAHSAGDDNGPVPSIPAPYGNIVTINTGNSGTSHVRMLTARREFAGASDDPPQFTIETSRNWGANTVAIRGTSPSVTIKAGHVVTTNVNVTVNALTVETGASLTLDASTITTVEGNWTNTGTFTAGTGSTFVMGGNTPQTMSGSTFYNLTFDNPAGVTLLTDETATNSLVFLDGIVTTGSNRIILNSSAPGALSIINGSINGTVQRNIAAGNQGTYRFTNLHTYIIPAPGQPARTAAVTSYPGIFPSPIANQGAAIKRHYEIQMSGSFNAANLALAYINGAENENPNLIDTFKVAVFRLRPGTTSWENYGPIDGNSERAVAFTVIDWNTKFAIGDGLQALPVQLASFTGAVVAGNNVRLDWRTISEVNNYGFYVQRRNMGATEWTEIPGSFVPGHGTTNEPRNYTYTDNTGISTATQYRLKQVDLDGTQHFTEPILVDLPTSVPEVAPKVFALSQNYPNPFNPSTEIKFTVEVTGRATLDVYNSLGQKVATLFDGIAEAGQFNTVRFNATGLASGVYFYRLQSGQKSDLKKLMLLK